jgi:hypothetical protein
MKNKFLSITLILLSLLFFGGCKDLNEDVYSEFATSNYYNTISQLQTQSLGMYLPFYRANYWDRYFLALTTMQSKYTMATETTMKSASIYGFDDSFTPISLVWEYAYQSINRANTIISNVYRVAGDKDVINNHTAEARFMRAWNYYVLVNLFGEVPLHVKETETVEGDAIMERSPVEDIYEVIVDDLKYAVDSLPVNWTTTEEGRPTKKAAVTLLGKVYLTMAGAPLKKTEYYAEAVTVLKDIAENPASYDCALLDNIADVYDVNNKNNDEMVFTIASTRGGAMSGATVLHYLFAGPQSLGIMTGKSPCTVGWVVSFSKDLYDLYEADDDRKKDIWAYSYVDQRGILITYGVSSVYKVTGKGIALRKYVDTQATGNTLGAQDRRIYRYAETLLLAAEAYAQTNDLANAVIHLNKVRARVHASQYVQGADFTTQEELLALIYKERSLELCGEFSEIFDIRRLNTVEDNFMNHYNRGSNNYDSKFTLYPIPLTETSYNTLITENNPGW